MTQRKKPRGKRVSLPNLYEDYPSITDSALYSFLVLPYETLPHDADKPPAVALSKEDFERRFPSQVRSLLNLPLSRDSYFGLPNVIPSYYEELRWSTIKQRVFYSIREGIPADVEFSLLHRQWDNQTLLSSKPLDFSNLVDAVASYNVLLYHRQKMSTGNVEYDITSFNQPDSHYENYYWARVEHVAMLAQLFAMQGVKIGGLLSVLFAWRYVYGNALDTYLVRLEQRETGLGLAKHEAGLNRVRHIIQALRRHVKTLSEAVARRVTTQDPKWDKAVHRLSREYAELLKSMLDTFEDVLCDAGADCEVAVQLPNMPVTFDRPSSYLESFDEYALQFARDVFVTQQSMQAGTFMPQWCLNLQSKKLSKAA